MMRTVGCCVMAAALTACAPAAQSVDVVRDLRILAVKAAPAEMLFRLTQLQPAPDGGPPDPPPPFSIQTQALVVDPQGRTVVVTQHLCPPLPNPDDGCRAEELGAAWQDAAAVRSATGPALRSAGGELEGLTQDWAVPPDALAELFAGVRRQPAPDWLGTSLVLVVRAVTQDGAEAEVAIKRFPLTLDMLFMAGSAQSDLEAALGFPWCTFSVITGDPSNVNSCLLPHVNNHNPHVDRMLYAPAPDDALAVLEQSIDVRIAGPDDNDLDSGGRFRDVTSPVVVHPGDAISLRPLVRNESHEHFQRVDLDERNGTFSLTPTWEDLAFSWFTTMGNISHTTTDRGRQAGSGLADAILRVPGSAAAGPAFVWMVARDQRGGVDWWRVEFAVEK